MVDKPAPDPAFESLLRYIQESRGLDFRGYKRTSLKRRIALRMEATGATGFDDYQARLEVNPGEFEALLNTVLINVTSFFRDADAWDVLRDEVIPKLIADSGDDRPIRIWSVGCATGQEPYSVAMLIADAIGVQAFYDRVKIYATDLDEDALKIARAAHYRPRDVEGVPDEYLERFFERVQDHYVFLRELRKCVIFGRHNVVFDAPISRIDLLVCRNLLIYLEPETQDVVLPRMHYALNPNGFLFLGKAETQLARSQLFRPTDMKHRIFSKSEQEWQRANGGRFGARQTQRTDPATSQVEILGAIVAASDDALLVIDDFGLVMLANPTARRLLGIVDDDIGRPFQDLAISYRPIELRGPIEEAFRLGRVVQLENQEFQLGSSDPLHLAISIQQLPNCGAVLLSFTDRTRLQAVQLELVNAHESLEQSVEQLQSANEELETTNEELQSTNEELETTNEELQSTNEELETLNEESRSSNEEMETVNEEMRLQAEQATNYRAYLESVLRAMNGGIIVVDDRRRIQSWNRWNETTWGLHADEITDTAFESLDIGLPLAKLANDIDDIETGREQHAEQVLEGVDRRGQRIVCRVQLTQLRDENGHGRGVVILFRNVTAKD